MFNSFTDVFGTFGQNNELRVALDFTSNNIQLDAIELTTSRIDGNIGYYAGTMSYAAYVDDGQTGTWNNTAYRTINITTPFYRNTNPTFYDWFVANAVKQ